MMHRRRRRSGKLSGWNLLNWARGGGGITPPSNAVAVAPSTPSTTKTALKAKAEKKSKLERELDRGTECCPVIRVKCERREVTFQVEKVKMEKYVANPYGGNTYKRKKVKVLVPEKRKVKLCSVTAGKHQGELLPPKEAKQEANMLRALLKAENCSVRTVGDKLGGK